MLPFGDLEIRDSPSNSGCFFAEMELICEVSTGVWGLPESTEFALGVFGELDLQSFRLNRLTVVHQRSSRGGMDVSGLGTR